MTVLEDALPPTGPELLGALPLLQLRARRAALQAEAARAVRWERLLQARLDLATDAVHPAERLEGPTCPALAAVLRAAVDGGAPGDLREVAALRRELHAYTAGLRALLAGATDELVARYAADPTRCLEAATGGGSDGTDR